MGYLFSFIGGTIAMSMACLLVNAPRRPFQTRVREWATECFGYDDATHPWVRVKRFFEEAVELAQAGYLSEPDAYAIVDAVYARQRGQVSQEVGGVMITLAAFCAAHGVNMVVEGEREYDRITDPNVIELIRYKTAQKDRDFAAATNPRP